LGKLLKKKITKIGILGGTFDPPHPGHVHISKIALKKLKLDSLIWIITKQNPLKKKPDLSTETRIQLSKNITTKQKKILIKYLDNKIKSKNTFDLLSYIKNKNKKKKLFFIIGSDNLIKFHKWKNWKKIPQLAKLVVFARRNYSVKALNSVASKKLDKNDWLYINSKKVNISSSLIKKFW
tara:strand:+ start:774 stop:1313 length:540 start_codon:yes stop_codon:yes gene_type:complete